MTRKRIYVIMIIIAICIGINLCCCEIYAADTIDSVMQGAQDFLDEGKTTNDDEDSGLNLVDVTGGTLDQTKLRSTSNFIFTVVLAISMVTAVIVGMIIGIKFMVATTDEKAKVKEALLPYVAGCVVAFGAIGIWKVAIAVLSNW